MVCSTGLVREAFGCVVVDINKKALDTYRLNAERSGGVNPFIIYNYDISSIKLDWLENHSFDIWFMSPPCQPHTRQGLQLDDKDPRSEPLRHIGQLLGTNTPDFKLPRLIVIENVPQFVESNSWKDLRQVLESRSYRIDQRIESALTFGFPNSRRRAYISCLLAPTSDFSGFNSPPMTTLPLKSISSFLQTSSHDDLFLSEQVLRKRSSRAMDIVLDTDVVPAGSTAFRPYTMCFTKNYGRYFNGTGSLLLEVKNNINLNIPQEGDLTYLTGYIRYFSPIEIAHLMGFNCDDFVFPSDLSRQACYSLIGNSLIPQVVAIIIRPYIELLFLSTPSNLYTRLCPSAPLSNM